jgi:hypothetical protein
VVLMCAHMKVGWSKQHIDCRKEHGERNHSEHTATGKCTQDRTEHNKFPGALASGNGGNHHTHLKRPLHQPRR